MTAPFVPDRSTPEALRAAWIAAVAAGDVEALRPLLSKDYELWAHGASSLRGPDTAIAAMRGALTRYHVEQRFEPVETIVADRWAFERGVEHITITPREGGSTTTVTQRALLILSRDSDGRWQYARGMTNGVPASESANVSESGT